MGELPIKSIILCIWSIPFHLLNFIFVGCAPSGLLDLSSCLPGQPRMFLSAAHLRGAADELRQSIDGIGGDKAAENGDDNDADYTNLGFFDIEPLTGAAVRVQQQFQMNLGMLRGKFRMTRNMRNFVMPMLRMNQIAVVDPFTKEQLLIPMNALHFSHIFAIVLISLGTFLTIISIGLAAFFSVKRNGKYVK
ncbi:hypothetical protein niasHT_039804 [Heterodera trifolii]|uniref:Uncharacterized protein n=1 Tax=Heterodera trifolii TaxID=157864 RepID=A0ABD2IQC7_9BILA